MRLSAIEIMLYPALSRNAYTDVLFIVITHVNTDNLPVTCELLWVGWGLETERKTNVC